MQKLQPNPEFKKRNTETLLSLDKRKRSAFCTEDSENRTPDSLVFAVRFSMPLFSCLPFQSIAEESEKEWKERIWDTRDILIDSNREEDQLAIRFAIYHLTIMTSRRFPRGTSLLYNRFWPRFSVRLPGCCSGVPVKPSIRTVRSRIFFPRDARKQKKYICRGKTPTDWFPKACSFSPRSFARIEWVERLREESWKQRFS